LAAQRAVVRMLFDPAFADAVRREPERVLPDLEPAVRQQLARLDERALRQDRLRRRRTLRTLSEELKASTTLALAQTRKLAFLDNFFCSAAFHRAVEERDSLVLALALFLTEALAEGRLQGRELGGVLALETTLARSRRDAQLPAPSLQSGWAALSPGVIAIGVRRGALNALQACERYLFELGLMPAVALCDDAPPLELPPWDETPLDLVTVPLATGVTLVEIDAPLGQLLRCLPAPRPIAKVIEEAAARGVEGAGEKLRELAADEIVILS